jgi:hypothetical protein
MIGQGPAGFAPAGGFVDPEAMARAQVFENDDGTLAVDLTPPADPANDPIRHDANLAEFIDDTQLNKLSGELKEAIEADKKSRTDWEQQYTQGMSLLGLKFEESATYPFKGACASFDSTMLEAVIRIQAEMRGEFLPNSGPVKTETVGEETQQTKDQASRIEQWMNIFLTKYSPEYYEDRDQMFFWLAGVGSMFTKTYNDPILGRPTQPYITPDKFIVNYNASSLMTASRLTHMINVSQRELMLYQQTGFYRDIKVDAPSGSPEESPTERAVNRIEGRSRSVYDGDREYRLAECHADIDLDSYLEGDVLKEGLPLPYIVTFDWDSQKVLAIRRNWKETDDRREKRRYFTHHKFFPGFGFYGLGYFHVLGGGAKVLTAITRQVVDAGTFANFPGGLRVRGMNNEETTLRIGPTEFTEIDLGPAQRIQDAIMPLPYKGADPNSIAFYDKLKNDTRSLANTSAIAVGEGRQDAPVGTTVALLEAARRPQSGIFRRIHKSMSEEFQLLAGLFAEILPETPYPFPVKGGVSAIMRQDFDGRVDVVPVSDPNVSSSAQRIMRAEGVLRIASSSPQLVDQREALARMFTEMGVPNVDKLIPPAPQPSPPMEPGAENVLALKGQQITVGWEQADDAHIAVHTPMLSLPQAAQTPPAPGAPAQPNPLALALTAHIQEHKANKARKMALQSLGLPPIPPGQPLPPQIENAIAEFSAQLAMMEQQQAAQAAAQNQSPDPASIMMADVEAKIAQSQSKERIEMRKAEVEKYKADLIAQARAQADDVKLKVATMNVAKDLNIKRPSPRFPGRA